MDEEVIIDNTFTLKLDALPKLMKDEDGNTYLSEKAFKQGHPKLVLASSIEAILDDKEGYEFCRTQSSEVSFLRNKTVNCDIWWNEQKKQRKRIITIQDNIGINSVLANIRQIVYDKNPATPIDEPLSLQDYDLNVQQLERDDGPASVIYSNNVLSEIAWCKGGLAHREDGPAKVVFRNMATIKHCVLEQAWMINGKRHRIDGPALINYYQWGGITREVWYLDDKHHRIGGPAITSYDIAGNLSYQGWYQDDLLVTIDDKPSEIEYRSSGEFKRKAWRVRDKNVDGRNTIAAFHRENGPAEIVYDNSGKVVLENWYVNGVKHRDGDLPAEIEYCDDKVRVEIWLKNGHMHRYNGPAKIIYNPRQKEKDIEISAYRFEAKTDEPYPRKIWMFHGQQIKDPEIPLIEDGRSIDGSKITREVIMRVMLNFDREYGSYLMQFLENNKSSEQ